MMTAIIEAGLMEKQAEEIDRKAGELEAEQAVNYNPRRYVYWQAEERIQAYRDKARELREQALQLRRNSA